MLPGLIVVWAATLVWAFEVQDARRVGWSSAIATAVVCRRARRAVRVPRAADEVRRRRRRTSWRSRWWWPWSGFFVIPVIGAPIGFVAAILLLELVKHRDAGRPGARLAQAIRAVGLNIGIELVTAFAIITTWAVGVYVMRAWDAWSRPRLTQRHSEGHRGDAESVVSEITTGRGGASPNAPPCAP